MARSPTYLAAAVLAALTALAVHRGAPVARADEEAERKAALAESNRLYEEAGALFRQKRYQEAIQHLERVLEIRQRVLGAEHRAVGALLADIGNTYYNLRAYPQAYDRLKRAIAIGEKTLPADSPEQATRYQGLGQTCRGLGRTAEWIGAIEACLRIREKALPAGHADIGTGRVVIGACRHSHGRQLRPYRREYGAFRFRAE